MLIALLIIFIFFSTLLKLSFWRLWQIALWAGVLVAFLWGSYDFASEQSQTTLSQWLASPKILSDMAVLITIESAIGLLFAFVFASFVKGELGGLTGDVYGATTMLTETLVLIVMLIASHWMESPEILWLMLC